MMSTTRTGVEDSRPALEVVARDFVHDLNNALTPMLVYTELLLRQPHDLTDVEMLTRRLQTMRTSARDAARLIRKLREFCRYSLILKDSPDLNPNPKAALPPPEADLRVVAELKEIHRRYDHLLTASAAVVYCCTPATVGHITRVSDNITAQLGYRPDEVVNDPRFWSGHLHPEDAPAALAVAGRLPDQQRLIVEYRFRHKNGDYRWLRDELRLIRDTTGSPSEIIGCWIDVTAEHHLRARLHQAQQLEAAARRAGDEARDLENLVALIAELSAHLEQAIPPGDPCRRYAAEIRHAGRRAGQLVSLDKQTIATADVPG